MLPFIATALGRSLALAFEAAEQTVDQAPVISTTAALAGHQGTIVRRRARQAFNNDGTIYNALSDLRDGLRGPMVLHSTDRETMVRIERWSRKVGWFLQFGTLAQVWARVAGEATNTGEVYVERVQVRPTDVTDNGLRLQVWGLDKVDRSKGVDGHEFSDQGVYAGTWFRGPATESNRNATSFVSSFVGDENLIAIRICYEAASVLGYPLPAPALKSARILDSLVLAEMDQAQRDATIHAFGLIPQPTIFGVGESPLTGGSSQFTDVDGNKIDEVTPGQLMLARGMSDVKTVQRRPGVIDYSNAQARVAAGVRSTSERIGGSLGNASFSALRGASDQHRRVVQNLDKDAGLDAARAELAEWYVESELLAGFVVDVTTLSWLETEREVVNERGKQAMA